MTCVSSPSEGNFIWSDHLRDAALGVGGGVGVRGHAPRENFDVCLFAVLHRISSILKHFLGFLTHFLRNSLFLSSDSEEKTTPKGYFSFSAENWVGRRPCVL